MPVPLHALAAQVSRLIGIYWIGGDELPDQPRQEA
jgi:hypothetical protein